MAAGSTPTPPVAGKREEGYRELIEIIVQAADNLPGGIPARDSLRRTIIGEAEKLKEMILQSRPPRILMLGRRGCGKSSLINAMFGQKVAEVGDVKAQTAAGRWFRYHSSYGELDVLDSRGLGDRTNPEGTEFDEALDEVKAAIDRDDKVPDIVLFLCKAKEVDAHVSEDIRLTQLLRDHVERKYDYRPPILALVTQVDELSPLRVNEPPYEDGVKQRAISLACHTLLEAFEEQQIELIKVLPVSTYAEFEDERIVYQRFWQIDELVRYLVEGLPSCSKLTMARAARVRSVQERMANKVVKSVSFLCGALATSPIPIADTFAITSAQLLMVTLIGFLSGRPLSKDSAKEFLAAMGVNVGAAFVFREVARNLVKWIPVAGQVVNASVAGAGTWAVGQAAILYFIHGASPAQARARLEEATKKPRPRTQPEGEDEREVPAA